MAAPDKEQGKERGGKTAAQPARKGPAEESPARKTAGRAAASYRALAPCRVGSYREAGEIFAWPRFEVCPAYLEEMKKIPAKPARASQAAPGATAPQAVPGAPEAEIFGG